MQSQATARRLILMRHGEAGTASAMGVAGDYERPLTQRGAVDVQQMAGWLKAQQWAPEAILCSPARRTRETARLIREGLSLPEHSEQVDEQLYLAEESTLLSVLAEQSAKIQTLMLVGHNPGLADLIARLSGQAHPVPPATMALLEAHTPDWQLSGQILQVHAVQQPGLE
ncbi:phosphohistidine phosphatase [Natronospira proteinivora]|uniref:Phosphohistidine phosphatase n=1 Tax=Natronospira proteinivora TaxID=1807133 RepID=A0ABT1G5H3_9GAMM|nr:histidine phosphatase family protein [Natronospira proteinivora]MCP1726551.1 phosphohistidine phosphatase [Natronospira proteinivora]